MQSCFWLYAALKTQCYTQNLHYAPQAKQLRFEDTEERLRQTRSFHIDRKVSFDTVSLESDEEALVFAKPLLLKSVSVPNFKLETPLSKVRTNLELLRQQHKDKYTAKLIAETLDLLKKPDGLTSFTRDLDCSVVDKTWFTFEEECYSLDDSDSVGISSTSSLDDTNNSINNVATTRLEVFKFGTWNVDVFALSEKLNNQPLTAMLMHIAVVRNWFEVLHIEKKVFISFCNEVERGYKAANPYHNQDHAADVVNSLYHLFNHCQFAARFDELTFFTGIIAAAVHDLQHPGVTATFLVHTKHELSMRYNDLSILEQMHLSETFKILSQPANDITALFKAEQYLKFRKLLIKAVMSTDLAHHGDTISKVKLNEEFIFSPNAEDTYEELIVCVALKIADVGHAGKCEKLHRRWSEHIQEEFYQQGDLERELKLPISMHMDRFQPDLPRNQLGFFKFIVIPLFECVDTTKHCPEPFHDIYNQLLANNAMWESQVNK